MVLCGRGEYMKIIQQMNRGKMPGNESMLNKGRVLLGGCLIMVLLLVSCAPLSPGPSEAGTGDDMAVAVAGEPMEAAPQEAAAMTAVEPEETPAEKYRSLPVRFQRPAYAVNQQKMKGEAGGTVGDEIIMRVGADVSSNSGPIELLDIIKRLAALKNMNASWASDVNQHLLVDVDIRAEDDFFKAIDNLLRQVDYFHEVQGNTIVVKYKETRKFHIAMPPRIAGTSTTGAAAGSVTNVETGTERWDSIRKNLDQILESWAVSATTAAPAPAGAEDGSEDNIPAAVVAAAPAEKGYYMIDESLGLITITAPRKLLDKVTSYVDSLKEELYRQISIEAKIIEVTLENESQTGIDWSSLFETNNSFEFTMDFGNSGEIYPDGGSFINKVSLGTKAFSVILDAIEKQGTTKVLANPKISVMNGQPAVIYVGDNFTYIDKVTTTLDEGAVSTSVTTAQAASGIRLEVFATVMNDDEIILSLIPIISGLTQPIQYKAFGTSEVGLPEVTERTMNSIVRLKNNEMLVVGGLIDTVDDDSGNKVSLLGDLPLIGRLFASDGKTSRRKELVILLRPRIL